MVNIAMKFDTEILNCGGRIEGDTLLPEAPAIYPSTAYIVADTHEYDRKNNEQEGFFYNRTRNPNRESLAEAISYLEKGEKTLICSSGMAAISTTLFALLKSGDHVVASKSIYGETIEVMDKMLTGFGVRISYVDFTDTDQIRAAIRPETKLFYSEVIANPLITVADIRKIATISKAAGAILIIDNTFSTPYIVNPIELGADIVIHSLTKFLNGHSDVTGGSITASAELIERITPAYWLLGGCLDANSAWLALRGLRTFGMRMERQMRNAALIAKALESDPHVIKVNYPGLESAPQHKLACEILHNGFGPMISFNVEDNRDKVDEFMHRLKIVEYLGTLGGYRTSIAHPATAFRFEFTPKQLVSMGMTDGLIRISTGAEDPEDIINDITQALRAFD